MKKYKVIFLDWNGTLSSSKFWGHLDDPTHLRNDLFISAKKSLFGNLRHLINPWMRGEKRSEEIIKAISDDVGLDYGDTLKEFVISCKKMVFVSEKVPKAIADFRKRGVKLVIATDNMDSFPRWTVPALKLDKLFDEILDSSRLGRLKNDFEPDGKNLFFESFMKSRKIKPRESLLVDDGEDKDNRIQNYGIDYLKIEPHVGLISALDKLARFV